ncbi:MAG: response regulator transcription factor [Candidatus Gracilibacteria bacterium]|nr:response regulator transcription factor [Candidatus Gracilibacteria bacterium]
MKIALIEDEKLLSTKIAKKIILNGFFVDIFNDAKSFILNNKEYNLYIIDIGLPDGNGLDIIKFLRETKKINKPIIIISGYNDIEKKVYGLNIGADDYLTKPFNPEELIARINALLRRNKKISKIKYDIFHKDLSYNYQNRKIFKNGMEVDLQVKEKQIVKFFISNKGKLVTKSDLISEVWGEHDKMFISNNNINVTLHKIRKKLGDSFDLETLHSEGYILR